MQHSYRYILPSLLSKKSAISEVEGTFAFYIRYYIGWQIQQLWQHRFNGCERVLIVSYPCSGRSWLDTMLVHALANAQNQPTSKYSTVIQTVLKASGWPLVDFTHAGSSWESATMTAAKAANLYPERFSADRFVFLWRDPRDIQVSAYHHMRTRSSITQISPADMLEDTIVGIEKVVAFMNVWAEFAERHPERILLLRYEDVRENPERELQKLLCFLGVELPVSCVSDAVKASSFPRMQRAEREGRMINPRLAHGTNRGKQAMKTRSGKLGQYRQFFDNTQINKLNYLVKTRLHKSFARQLEFP